MAFTLKDLEDSKKKLKPKKDVVASQALKSLLDKAKPEAKMSMEKPISEQPNMSIGEPASFPSKQPKMLQKALAKDAKKVDKGLNQLQEGITGEKVTKNNEMSEDMKTALIAGLPILIGGLLGGEAGIGAGAKGALAGLDVQRKEKAAEQQAELKQAEIDARTEIEANKIASAEKLANINSMSKLLGLKQQSEKELLEKTVPDVGIALSKDDSKILKEKKTVLNNVTDGIDRLTAIGNTNLATLSPEQRTAAQTEVQALIGQLRIPLTGPGPLTDTEREFMENIIGNPTKIFSLSSNEQVKLDTIKSKFVNDFENEKKLRTVEGLQQSKIEEELKRRGLR